MLKYDVTEMSKELCELRIFLHARKPFPFEERGGKINVLKRSLFQEADAQPLLFSTRSSCQVHATILATVFQERGDYCSQSRTTPNSHSAITQQSA